MVTPPVPWADAPMLDQPLVKKFFLVCNLSLPWHNLKRFPLVLSVVTLEKRLTPTRPINPAQQSSEQQNHRSIQALSNQFHQENAVKQGVKGFPKV